VIGTIIGASADQLPPWCTSACGCHLQVHCICTLVNECSLAELPGAGTGTDTNPQSLQVRDGVYALDCSCRGFDSVLEFVRNRSLPLHLTSDDLVCDAAFHHCAFQRAPCQRRNVQHTPALHHPSVLG
jgi:hypothetical protein